MSNKIYTDNNIQHTPYYLIALLTFNMLLVASVTIVLLYNFGFARNEERLLDLVETQSVMINIVAKQALNERPPHTSDIAMHTVSANFIRQITKTYPQYGAIGKSGEFTLGQRNGTNIGFILKQRYFDEHNQMSIPWNSTLAEPMRRALNGKKGVDIMLDYRGVYVLAAYKPIPDLGWGIVAKIDLNEIRAPYIRAAIYAFLFTLILAVLGSIVFWFFLNPLVNEIEESHQFNQLLISKSATGLLLCTFDGKIIDANESFLKILGCSFKQLLHLDYMDLISDKYIESQEDSLNILREKGTLQPTECCYIHSLGWDIPIRVSGELVKMKNILYLWLSVEDFSDYKKREAELLLSSTVFDNTQEAIFITDSEKKIIKANQAFTSVTGFSLEEVLGKNPSFLKSGRHDASFYENMYKSIQDTGTWQGEIWNKRKNGTLFPSLQSISAIYDDTHKLIRFVSILTDISIQKAYEQKLVNHAHHDSLTGLPNRLNFEQKFEQILFHAQQTQQKFALFFIDLNRFKEVNDTMGHDVGDTLLKFAATSFKQGIRTGDVAARLGGDEFVILLPTISSQMESIQIAKHIMHETQQTIHIGEFTLQPSISIGIAIYPDHGNDRYTLMKHADEAMYYAKHYTNEHIHIYTDVQPTLN